MSQQPIVHVELSVHGTKTASEFYSQLFGWKTEAMPEMETFTFDEEPGIGGDFPRVDDATIQPVDTIGLRRKAVGKLP